MQGRSAKRKPRERVKSIDKEIVEALHRLPVERQRSYIVQILDDARQLEKVISIDEILSETEILEEAKRLAAAAGLPVQEIAAVVNPFRYWSYVARGRRCGFTKLTAIDYSRYGDVSETIVNARAYKDVLFRHSIVPASFDVHVYRGDVRVETGETVSMGKRGDVLQVEGGAEVVIRLPAGAWITYVDHPLTAWILQRALRA